MSNPNVTPEGIEVKAGQPWKNLDVRSPYHCQVLSVKDGVAQMSRWSPNEALRTTHVMVRRMKKASTGWALVEDKNV